MEKVIFSMDGIKNDTEKLQMKKALEKIDGVNKINIDRMESEIEVDYNPKATKEEIRECIESTGHHIKDVQY